ncbi:cobyric acid synthase [Natronosalvus vescus]|uniref:cobyric acid synthase n=1 Tax=Natronosalvus vescus TaxID=2953881 RepID=UPI0020900567|nr:cobyric acid synthase [Natronosalvus vescus]
MARTILVAGTASHVGKSTVASGLCRILADRGVAVTPYKAQNMSNNARVVPRVLGAESVRGIDERIGGTSDSASGDTEGDGAAWGEIGVSQFVQCRAARVTPTTDVNPVLLKPTGDGESQLIVQGRAVGSFSAGSYYDDCWAMARGAAERSYRRLAAEYDVVIAEGAGSIAEINLHDRDLANVETARFADADIILVADIERGGAFASLYGTLELMPDDLRDRVCGAIITKFRGDASLLESGIRHLEERTGVPILGVIPAADTGLPEEDSVSLPSPDEGRIRGADDGVPDEQSITIAVPRFPRLSNATDLEALRAEPGVRLAYVPLEGAGVGSPGSGSGRQQPSLANADAVVLPGSKNTVDDLRAVYAAGFDAALEQFDGPIVGLCGGYQMLGTRLCHVEREGTDLNASAANSAPDRNERAHQGTGNELTGLGLLPVETTFEPTKHLEQVTVPVDGTASPLLAGAAGTATGYEIHAGRTRILEPSAVSHPLGPESAAAGLVLGTYLHGLFDNDGVRSAFLDCVRRRAGVPTGEVLADSYSESERAGRTSDRSGAPRAGSPYDRARDLIDAHVDLEALELG